MTTWKRTLHLMPEWAKAQDGELPFPQLAAVVAARIRALQPFDDADIEHERNEIAADFEDLSTNYDLEADEFDDAMERLYDWGDQSLNPNAPFFKQEKVCWINTHRNRMLNEIESSCS